jgi:uncharacterized protein YggE
MRRTIPFGLAVASLLAAGAFLGVAAQAQNIRDGKIRVLGRASVEVVPDYATVRVGISNRAPTPTAALDQNSAAARKIITFSKTFGAAERDIATDSVSLGPAFKNVREPNGAMRQEPDGYGANNTVRVRLGDVSRVGAYMRQVLDHGATQISGVSFGVSDPDSFSDQARASAVEDALRQARRLVAAANVKLGPIHEIVHPPRVQFSYADGPAALDRPVRRAGSMTVPIEVGTVRITAEVDVTWAIE